MSAEPIGNTLVLSTLFENGYNYSHKLSKVAGQWVWDHATKFARWQHPAVGCGAEFAVRD